MIWISSLLEKYIRLPYIANRAIYSAKGEDQVPELYGYNEKIPENAREIFMWLCQDVVALHRKWDLYQGLFSDSETTELLSDLARGTFQVIEESLRDDMTMSIGRLSDPSTSCGHANVSIRALLDQLPDLYRLALGVDDFLRSCEPIVQLRNRRVAHNDKDTLLEPKENPLPGISKDTISAIIERAEVILDTILRQFDDETEMMYELITVGGANTLVRWLKLAKEYSDTQRQTSGCR